MVPLKGLLFMKFSTLRGHTSLPAPPSFVRLQEHNGLRRHGGHSAGLTMIQVQHEYYVKLRKLMLSAIQLQSQTMA
jgi:hypothetical protein